MLKETSCESRYGGCRLEWVTGQTKLAIVATTWRNFYVCRQSHQRNADGGDCLPVFNLLRLYDQILHVGLTFIDRGRHGCVQTSFLLGLVCWTSLKVSETRKQREGWNVIRRESVTDTVLISAGGAIMRQATLTDVGVRMNVVVPAQYARYPFFTFHPYKR